MPCSGWLVHPEQQGPVHGARDSDRDEVVESRFEHELDQSIIVEAQHQIVWWFTEAQRQLVLQINARSL